MRKYELEDFEIGPYVIDVVCTISDEASYPVVYRLVNVDWKRIVDETGKTVDVDDAVSEIWDDLEDYLNTNADCLPYEEV